MPSVQTSAICGDQHGAGEALLTGYLVVRVDDGVFVEDSEASAASVMRAVGHNMSIRRAIRLHLL